MHNCGSGISSTSCKLYQRFANRELGAVLRFAQMLAILRPHYGIRARWYDVKWSGILLFSEPAVGYSIPKRNEKWAINLSTVPPSSRYVQIGSNSSRIQGLKFQGIFRHRDQQPEYSCLAKVKNRLATQSPNHPIKYTSPTKNSLAICNRPSLQPSKWKQGASSRIIRRCRIILQPSI